jgi:hypothetical protein
VTLPVEHTIQLRKIKKLGNLNIGNSSVAPLDGSVRNEVQKEYDDKTKESYIGIEALPENDHSESIRWRWYTYGNSVGPLKETTLMVSIGFPEDNNISQLTASFEARAKYSERNIVGNIRRIIAGETAEMRTGSFQVTVQ